MDLTRDIVLAFSGVVVLVMLNQAQKSRRSMPAEVAHFMLLGFLLLLSGRVLEILGDVGIVTHPLVKLFAQEMLGYLGGFLFVGIALIRWIPTVVNKAVKATRPVLAAGTPVPGIPAVEMLNSVLRSSLAGVLVLKCKRDDDRNVLDFEVQLVNQAAEQLLGRSARDLSGRDLLQQLPCIAAASLLDHAVSVVETGLPYRDERLFTHGRIQTWFQFNAAKLGDGLAVTFSDVSARRKAEEQLRYAAQHDTLTGLANRSLFTERLKQAINRSQRVPDYRFAVLFLDFDRFKIINDSLGHEIGDLLLIAIAGRLRSTLTSDTPPSHSEDGHLPARLGGDEFVILLDGIGDVGDAVELAERLQRELLRPHNLDGHEVISSASIGIVTSENGYKRADDIIRDADTAMYKAKTTGKARHVVFDQRMHHEAVGRLNLERQLRETVEHEDMQLEFQPIVSLTDGRLLGVETSIRWPDFAEGDASSPEIVELAEELGLIVPVGEWILAEACRTRAAWQKRFPHHPPISVHIGMRQPQLLHPDLLPSLQRIIGQTGIAPESVRLGVTESMLIDDMGSAAKVLGELNDLGVKMLLDSFGSGHSSLSCLHRFPVHVLRIDRSFIDDRKQNHETIIRAIVGLAHNLDLEIIADGVADGDQFAMLKALGCDCGQGSLFSDPMPADQVEQLLDNRWHFNAAA